MAFNLTGIDMNLYFAVNTSVNILLFGLVVLPTLILCVLCVLALFLAEGLIWQMKVLLINLFAAEVCNWLGRSLLLVGFPVWASLELEVDPACSVAISLFIVSTLQKMTATTLYAIMVYMFIKYNVKKLKWQVIVTYIAISWVVSLGMSIIPYFPEFGLFNNNGFCDIDSESVLLNSSAPVILVLVFICVIIITTFTILTYCYTKKNTLEGSVEVKKAIARNLQYLMIASIVTLVFNTVPAFSSLVRAAFAESGVVVQISINYIELVFLNLPSVATPIATIVILKPVRVAVREVCSKMCACCKSRAVGDSTTRAQ